MNRVTTGACHIRHRVLRPPHIHFPKIARVASQAGVQHGFRLHQRERPWNGSLAAVRFHVRFARPVAAFASGTLRRLVAAGDALIMRVLVEVEPDVRVAGLTDGPADVVGGHQRNTHRNEEYPPTDHSFNIVNKTLNTCKFCGCRVRGQSLLWTRAGAANIKTPSCRTKLAAIHSANLPLPVTMPENG